MSRRLASLVAGPMLFAGSLSAQDYSGGTNGLPFRVALRNEIFTGTEQVRRAYVSIGTNVFTLVLPPGFQMDASNPNRIVFVNADYSCYLTFSIIAPRGEMRPGFCRGLAQRWHPGAKISEEFPQSTGSYLGTACDLQWVNLNGSAQSARVAYASAAAGILQFTLLTQADKFAEGQKAFNSLVWSCHSNEGGNAPAASVSRSTVSES
jgi:hypothetical protein